MSDNPDFRGSREGKRQDETLMITSDQLADMVSQAKDVTEPAPVAAPAESPAVVASASSDGSANRTPMLIGIAVAVVVVLIILFLVV